MAAVIMPDCGGPWAFDSGGGDNDGGGPPSEVMKHLSDYGKNGIVISGLIAWIDV